MIHEVLKKTAVVFAGTIIMLIFLEIALRLGGAIFLQLQHFSNLRSIQEKGGYTILCIGESNTQDQYPGILERMLNERHTGIRFKVIDEGRTNVNSTALLSQIEDHIARFQPDLVVAMMGINDKRIQYYQDIPDSPSWLFQHCRIYRLGRLLAASFSLRPFHAAQFSGASGEERTDLMQNKSTVAHTVRSATANAQKDPGSGDEGDRLRKRGEFLRAEAYFQKAQALNPNNDHAYLEFGKLLRQLGEFSRSEVILQKTIGINPRNYQAYIELGDTYLKRGRYSKARDSFLKALELDPHSIAGYTGWGWACRGLGDLSQAEQAFKSAIGLAPNNDGPYFALGSLYQSEGKPILAEEFLKKAWELNPRNGIACLTLVWIYRNQGALLKAEALLKDAIRIDPKNDRAAHALAALRETQESTAETSSPSFAPTPNEPDYITPVTITNYLKLHRILEERGIQLMCVQYPLRDVGSLKKIFAGVAGVLFVDNNGSFRSAIKNNGYAPYFQDLFAGDFGHCTLQGNTLLAQNIAAVILKEVLGKKQ